MDPVGVGFIQIYPDVPARPLTEAEAQLAFDAMAARSDLIAFHHLAEGCESRAQLMIEEMERMGIHPGRTWILSVGRPLRVVVMNQPKRILCKWYNHTAPTVTVGSGADGVRIIDPSIPGVAGPLDILAWATAMGAKSIEVLQLPAAQVEIIELQRQRFLAGSDLDAVAFLLPLGVAPIPEKGGSGFRIDSDPAEGPNRFAHAEMQRLLAIPNQ